MARNFKLKPWVYAGLMALMPLSADAAGLGKLTVTSALGQPLRAEIELLSVQKDEMGSLTARLASAEAFREAQLERGTALLGMKFSIEQKKDGSPILKLSTTQPVNEPFLDMLVELNWSAGRLLREYTVLLDPQGFSETQPVFSPVAAPVARSVTVAPEPQKDVSASEIYIGETPSAKQAKAVKVERKPVEPMQAPAESAGSYGPVKKGDTLAGIASQLKPEGYSLEQMLVALYQSNTQAFSGKNMHRLKTGQILRVPDAQQIGSVGRAEANHELKAHTADWNAYRQKLAAAVDEMPTPKEAAPKQEAKGKITAAVEDKAAPAPAPSKDVLKVTKGEAANGKEVQSLQSKIQSLQEETTAREKSLKDANSRIAALEKSVKEMQQLVELKNKNLADLQKQAATKPEPESTPKPVEVAPKAAEPVAPPVEAVVKPAEPEAAPVDAPKPESVKPPAPPKVEPSKPEPVVAPKPELGLLDNPLYLAAGAGALVLLGGGALIAINRRRRKSLSSFEDSILTGGDLKANTVFGETAGGVVDTGDTSFLTDFSQAGLGTIDTNDVDPIAEAEVYMAYGRDAQAEEILKEAMVKDSGRHEIHLKLLEIYAARKNLIAFETLAGELYAAIGGQASSLWNKAAEMGHALDPNNPLYGTHEVVAAKSVPEDVFDAGVDLNEPTLGLMDEEALSANDLSPDLDLGVDEVEMEAAAPVGEEVTEALVAPESAEDEMGVLDFDLDTFAEKPAEMIPAADIAGEGEVENVLEFDLGELMQPQELAEAEAEPIAEPIVSESVVVDDLAMDLDTLMMPVEAEAIAGEEVVAEAVSAAEEAMPDFSLDLPEFTSTGTVEEITLPDMEDAPIVAGAAPDVEEDAHLDFDFDLAAEMPVMDEEAMAPILPELDLSGISLDLNEPEEMEVATESTSDDDFGVAEVATKLDLARAYVDMGDKDGAKEILDEVLKEGSDQQKTEANQLLASL